MSLVKIFKFNCYDDFLPTKIDEILNFSKENECANLGELMDNLDMMSDFEYPTVDDYFHFKKHTDSRHVT